MAQIQSYAGLEGSILCRRRASLGQKLSRLLASILQRADEDRNTGRIIYGRRRTVSVSRAGHGEKLWLLVRSSGHGGEAGAGWEGMQELGDSLDAVL